jgi:outer membrane protein TolC
LISRAHGKTACKSRRHWAPAFAGLALAAGSVVCPAQISLTTVVELAQQKSDPVRLAVADVQKSQAQLAQGHDAFIPSLSCGSGLPAFPEVGFTGSLPTIWDCTIQSLVFSLPQLSDIKAAHAGLDAAQLSLKNAKEQVALDASTAYIELDTVDSELEACKQQEQFAARLVGIEQQRTDAGVDPLSALLQARLTAAQFKLKRIQLESRAATLAKQLATLTGLPLVTITPDHASIPEVPAVTADEAPAATAATESAQAVARSRERVAKADEQRMWLIPEIGFGAQYNRNTTLLNNINQYYARPLPANNLSTGFSIKVYLFDAELHAKAHESRAEALRARVEAEEAQWQNDIQITTLNGTVRELDAQAEIASLQQQIAAEQLKSVMAQLELGNGAGNGPGAPAQLSPTAEQQARIDERQKYLDALDAGLNLSKARLELLRAFGHMQDWLNELHAK